MNKEITNKNARVTENKRNFDVKYVFVICALFMALIVGRSLNDLFFYVLATVGVIIFAASSTPHNIAFLFFLLPFSNILKQDVGSISLFTVLFFLLILKMVITIRKIDVRLCLCALLFIGYGLIFSGLGQITTIVTIVAGSIGLYYVRYENIDAQPVVFSYASGLCLSSILAFFKEQLPIVNAFVKEETIRLEGGEELISRFSGLHGNPNYYTIDIIVVIAAIIVLIYNQKKIKLPHVAFIIALSIFGLFSLSKSFLLVWIIVLLCWFLLSLKQGIGRVAQLMFVVILGAVAVYYFAYDSVSAYLARLIGDAGSSIGDITTGRSDIWVEYINVIFDDVKILFFGNGLNTIIASVGKGTHNTYLESIFYLGIIGTIILLVLIRMSVGKISLKRAIWLPVLVLAIRMLAIGILTYDNIWLYLLLIVILSIESKKHSKCIDV